MKSQVQNFTVYYRGITIGEHRARTALEAVTHNWGPAHNGTLVAIPSNSHRTLHEKAIVESKVVPQSAF